MAQGGHGSIGFFEDFKSNSDDDILAVVDANGLAWNDIFIVAQSGQLDIIGLATETGGVMRFNGAGGAADGVALISAPMSPSVNGAISTEIRFKASAVTAFRFFFGWAETVDRDENVIPFSLSGTTLTANNAGQCAGVYFDTAATADDVRFMASSDGVAATSAKGLNGVVLGSLGKAFGTSLVADSYIYIRIEMDPDGAVRAFYGDVTTDPANNGPKLLGGLAAGVLDTTALYTPLFHIVDTSTGDANYDVDFFGGEGYRDWSY